MSSSRKIVLYALLSSIIIVSKEALSWLPNIELVTFLFMIYAININIYGTITIAMVFCIVESLLYGIGMWTPMYFIVWPLIVICTYLLKNKLNNYFKMALFAAFWGLIFGALFSIPYFAVSFKTGWIYWLNGIMFDVLHAISNYLIMLILFDPVDRQFKRLIKNYTK